MSTATEASPMTALRKFQGYIEQMTATYYGRMFLAGMLIVVGGTIIVVVTKQPFPMGFTVLAGGCLAFYGAWKAEYGQMLIEAADTIERLQKERNEGWADALRVQTERDAALAEVERLKGAPRCNLCGALISGDPPSGLGKHVFCSTCCAR